MRAGFLKKFIVFLGLGIVVSLGFGYLAFQYFSTVKELNETKESFSIKEAEVVELTRNVKKLEEELSQATQENASLSDSLQGETERNDSFGRQIQSITSSVGVLEKLKQTDKELLQKYSRVYFLNENYVPSKLTQIDQKYLYDKKKIMSVQINVQKYLYMLMEDANVNNAPLQIVSAYRSFGQQESLKTGYVTTYGSGANKFSADQGYSEHQLGTAIDFTTPKLGASFEKIESEPAYTWLVENAHRYGFILSYPKKNAYYQFEPWHWRFVGVTLAGQLRNRNQYFYDMAQREIDTYLISIFD